VDAVLSTDTNQALRFYAEQVLRSVLTSWWREPRAPGPPPRDWLDWVLVGVLVLAALLEGVLRPDVVWRPVATVSAMALVPVLLWRRTHPLAVVVIAFGTFLAFSIVDLVISADEPVGLYTNAFVVMLSYSLFRWGSGREMALGLPVMLLAAGAALSLDWTGALDAVAAMVFLLFPAALGATVRYRQSARAREVEQMKTSEREQLARELHDTVAHHVSAIAVRAQAGRVVAQHRSEAALEALGVIEREASRTLEELRTIVGVLRDGDEADLAPQRGVPDIAALTREDPQHVEVTLTGELEDLPPRVGAALFRIAQESLTNAMKHAREATRVDIGLVGEPGCVRLTVHDDGAPTTGWSTAGYGLVGMTERATLLGGSLHAGPHQDGGWCVEAVIPRDGRAR
jgi:signal transduction histidine kinase